MYGVFPSMGDRYRAVPFYSSVSNYLSSHDDPARENNAPFTAFDPDIKKGRPRALVVDDTPDVTEMIAMLLRHSGYDVMMVFSAPEALKAAQSEQFDVIVSDIGMPGMNGYDLAMALRALPVYASVPMIAVTGFAMYDDRDRAFESGFNSFLTKPINPMDLIDELKRLRG